MPLLHFFPLSSPKSLFYSKTVKLCLDKALKIPKVNCNPQFTQTLSVLSKFHSLSVDQTRKAAENFLLLAQKTYGVSTEGETGKFS